MDLHANYQRTTNPCKIDNWRLVKGFNLRTFYRGHCIPRRHLGTRSTSPFLKRVSVDNLKLTLQQANKHDVAVGHAAYARYNRIITLMATQTGATPRTAAAVFSALSPNNDYFGNLRDAHTLLRAAAQGRTLGDFKVSTYGHNKRKAWAIAHGIEPLEVIVAPKTRSFFLNVADPNDPQPVTIDGHMYNIWSNKRQNLVGLKWRKSQYEEIAEDVRKLAREQGCVPCQMQAILWHTWRRIHRIKTTAQLSLWDEDLMAAQLGAHPYQPCPPPVPPAHGCNPSSNGCAHL